MYVTYFNFYWSVMLPILSSRWGNHLFSICSRGTELFVTGVLYKNNAQWTSCISKCAAIVQWCKRLLKWLRLCHHLFWYIIAGKGSGWSKYKWMSGRTSGWTSTRTGNRIHWDYKRFMDVSGHLHGRNLLRFSF